MRTTVDIDDPILKDLKKLQKRQKKSLGRLVSDLLAQALGQTSSDKPAAFRWISRPMGARVDLADREAILAAMDERGTEP
jgi:hypothetical protein